METPSIVFYEHSFDDTTVKSLAKSVLNLGNECRALSEENTRLKAEVERLDTLCKQLGKQHSDISCENIMLRKAGDALFHNLLMVKHHCPDNGNTHHMIDASILGWNPKYGTTE